MVTAQSKNIVSVDKFGGIYCVKVDPSIDVFSSVALATSDFSFAVVAVAPGGCSSNGTSGEQVNIYNPSTGNTEDGSFEIMVP